MFGDSKVTNVKDSFGRPLGRIEERNGRSDVTDSTGRNIGSSNSNGTFDSTGSKVFDSNTPGGLFGRK